MDADRGLLQRPFQHPCQRIAIRAEMGKIIPFQLRHRRLADQHPIHIGAFAHPAAYDPQQPRQDRYIAIMIDRQQTGGQ